MLERILVPLDGSELADEILRPLTATLARASEVSLLSVVASQDLPKDHAPGKNPLTLARQHLAARRDELVARGAQAHSRLTIGDAAAKILDFAREHMSTLIVMSTHGRSGASRIFRGSVAERVLRHSSVPVLLANPKALEGRDELKFKKILVPLDGSEMSSEVLPLVAELAKYHGSEVTLFYSVPIAVTTEPWVVTAPVMTLQEGQNVLAPFETRLPGVTVKRLAEMGDPASNILELVEREKIDLVAMTTHGRSGASRWFFGSVAESVIRHAACPLLVKRTAGPPIAAPARRAASEQRPEPASR
jgi:nucleotide-binding universal stress UspA family protein